MNKMKTEFFVLGLDRHVVIIDNLSFLFNLAMDHNLLLPQPPSNYICEHAHTHSHTGVRKKEKICLRI